MRKKVKAWKIPGPPRAISSASAASRVSARPLNVKKWKSKSLWKEREVPFLFLGLEPESRELLSRTEKILRRQYFDLLEVAMAKDELAYFEGMPDRAFEPGEIIRWRKSVSTIVPATNYLRLESAMARSRSKPEKEIECRKWLEKLMEGDSQQTARKADYQADARQKFGIGATVFNRAWTNALALSGNTNWGRRGRKSTGK